MKYAVRFGASLTCLHCQSLVESHRTQLQTAHLYYLVAGRTVEPGGLIEAGIEDLSQSYKPVRKPAADETSIFALERWVCPVCQNEQWAMIEFERVDPMHLRFVHATSVPLVPKTLEGVHFVSARLYLDEPGPETDALVEKLAQLAESRLTVAQTRAGVKFDEDEDDLDIEEPASEPAAPTMPPPPQPLERPPGEPSDDYFREIEAIAVEVDQLESTASDEKSRGRLSARRQRLLIELDVAGVLDEASQLGPRLRALQLTKLVGYSDAAAALWRYYNSAGRARFVKTPKPAKLLDGDISLDWFRVPSGYVPEGDGITPESWLGLCEANFAFDRPKRGGQSWLRLERRIHRMDYRGELTNTPKLVRVVPG